MSRLSVQTVEKLSPEHREAYERIAKVRSPSASGRFGGPFDAWVRSPELSRRAMGFGSFLWERTTLDRRIVELAILVTARFWKSNVEWFGHSARAREFGVSPAVIDAILAERRPDTAPEDEQAAYDFCRALHETHRAPAELYEPAVRVFGEQGVAELVAVIGYYTFVAMTLSAFEIGLPAGVQAPFRFNNQTTEAKQ
jgi:4-carboxymuconolactone decarboxylase